ncbi:Mitotic-spindle organizing protein [Trichinella pseudospiralis]
MRELPLSEVNEDCLNCLHRIAKLLKVDLDRESLAICVRLIEAGVDPERLAIIVCEVDNLSSGKLPTVKTGHKKNA